MTCSDDHLFKPFPRSRDLYCSACGMVLGSSQQPASASPKWSQSSTPVNPVNPVNPQDPDRDDALEILRANQNPPDVQAKFEAELDEMFHRYELPPDVAQDLYNEALRFGPKLNIKDFENQWVAPIAAIQPQPTEDRELSEILGD